MGKRRRTHNPGLRSEQLDVAIVRIRDSRGRGGYMKDKGEQEDVCSKSKCNRCGRKVHFHHECTLEVELCHRCHQPCHIRENSPRLVVGAAQVPSQILRQEERVMVSLDDIAGMLSFAFFLAIIIIYNALEFFLVSLSLSLVRFFAIVWVISSRFFYAFLDAMNH